MTDRLRGRAGMRQRERRLKRTNGLCELCLAHRVTRIATIVDHIVPLTQDGPDIDENTRNVCAEHDRSVTAQQFGRERSKGLGGCDARGLPSDPGHPWNRI